MVDKRFNCVIDQTKRPFSIEPILLNSMRTALNNKLLKWKIRIQACVTCNNCLLFRVILFYPTLQVVILRII